MQPTSTVRTEIEVKEIFGLIKDEAKMNADQTPDPKNCVVCYPETDICRLTKTTIITLFKAHIEGPSKTPYILAFRRVEDKKCFYDGAALVRRYFSDKAKKFDIGGISFFVHVPGADINMKREMILRKFSLKHVAPTGSLSKLQEASLTALVPGSV